MHPEPETGVTLADVGIRVSRWQVHPEIDKYPTVELVPSEVTAILESPRGIKVETNERLKKLFLPNKLSDCEGFAADCFCGVPP
jgi:hypothetical protein